MADEPDNSKNPDSLGAKRRADLHFCLIVLGLSIGSLGCLWIPASLHESFGNFGPYLFCVVMLGQAMVIAAVWLGIAIVVIPFRNRNDLKMWLLATAAVGCCILAATVWVSRWASFLESIMELD